MGKLNKNQWFQVFLIAALVSLGAVVLGPILRMHHNSAASGLPPSANAPASPTASPSGGGLLQHSRRYRTFATDSPAAAKLRVDAVNGDVNAQLKLGDLYHLGIGVPVNNSEVFIWYRSAADVGNPDGIFWVGGCYQNGWGVPKDLEKAAALLRKSAEMGHAKAECQLGYCFAEAWALPGTGWKRFGGIAKPLSKGNQAAKISLAVVTNWGSGCQWT